MVTSAEFFNQLEEISAKPEPFCAYTSLDMWNDPYVSKKMLELHLNNDVVSASRPKVMIDMSCEWIMQHFSLNDAHHLIDLGCGPGLYTQRFAELGLQVSGVDVSKVSIEYAKEKAIECQFDIDYQCANYLELQSKSQFDLATMIFCDFSVLSPKQVTILLNRVKHLLKPSGHFIFDVYTKPYFDAFMEANFYIDYHQQDDWARFWTDEANYAFKYCFKYEHEQLLLEKYTIIEKERLRTFYNWFQCYSLSKIKTVLEAAGFEFCEVYQNVCGEEYSELAAEMSIVAKKK